MQEKIIEDLADTLIVSLNQRIVEIATCKDTISKMTAQIHSLKGAISELEDKHAEQYDVIISFNHQKDEAIEILENEIGRLEDLIQNV